MRLTLRAHTELNLACDDLRHDGSIKGTEPDHKVKKQSLKQW